MYRELYEKNKREYLNLKQTNMKGGDDFAFIAPNNGMIGIAANCNILVKFHKENYFKYIDSSDLKVVKWWAKGTYSLKHISGYTSFDTVKAIEILKRRKDKTELYILGPGYAPKAEPNVPSKYNFGDFQISVTGTGKVGENHEQALIREVNEEVLLNFDLDKAHLISVTDMGPYMNKIYKVYMININDCEGYGRLLESNNNKDDDKIKVEMIIYGKLDDFERVIKGVKSAGKNEDGMDRVVIIPLECITLDYTHNICIIDNEEKVKRERERGELEKAIIEREREQELKREILYESLYQSRHDNLYYPYTKGILEDDIYNKGIEVTKNDNIEKYDQEKNARLIDKMRNIL